MRDFFLVFAPEHLPFLSEGAAMTVLITAASMVLGTLLGLVLALARLSGRSWLVLPVRAYVEVVRDVPLLVQLLLIYFSLPELGIRLPALEAGILGLSLNLGAYASEVFRAALAAVDPGQRQAALALGLPTRLAYRKVILPQALRVALPTLGGYLVSLLKDCALVSYISVNELLRNGQIVISGTFRSMETYLLIAIIYGLMSFVASRLVRAAERRLTPAHLR